MPAPLAVDKEAVRVLVVAVGVRQAARQMGIAEGTVQDWSATGKWLSACQPRPATQPLPLSMQSPTSPTISPAEALANELADLSNGSRLSLSRAVRRGAAHAEQLDADDIIERADKLASLVKSAATLGGWADVSAVPVVNIAFLSAGADDRRTRNIESVEVDAQVVEDQGA